MYPRQFLISTLYFISRQQITNPKYIISYPEVHHQHGLISTGIGLSMRINSQYFEDGVLRIKCVASISPIIWSGNKETVIQQQGLQQFEIPLPSIDTREVLFLGELCVAVQHFKLSFCNEISFHIAGTQWESFASGSVWKFCACSEMYTGLGDKMRISSKLHTWKFVPQVRGRR